VAWIPGSRGARHRAALYDLFVDQGHAGMDFSGIIKLLDHE